MSTLTRAERETVIVWSEADDQISITSSSPSQIAKLRKDDRFTETNSRFTDGQTAEFLIPVADFTLTKGAKRRVSEEERARLAARFRGAAA